MRSARGTGDFAQKRTEYSRRARERAERIRIPRARHEASPLSGEGIVLMFLKRKEAKYLTCFPFFSQFYIDPETGVL
jgi:hypothetical protein